MKKNVHSENTLKHLNAPLKDVTPIDLNHIVLDNKEILNDHDMMKLLGVSNRTLCSYRKKNIIPYFKVGGRCMYLRSMLIMTFLKINND